MTQDQSRQRVVIVGAGLAGSRTAELLRSRGFEGEIVVLGAEPHLPYDRPPLSKAALAGDADTTFEVDYAALSVDVRTGARVSAVDTVRKVVRVCGPTGADEREVGYDALVIATGADPIRLPGSGEQLVLRTREDAAELRAALVPGAHVVLVGAGWINAEVATAAVAAGCSVTCLERGASPLAAVLGEEIGARLGELWSGVDLRCGVGVQEIVDGGVVTDSGERIDADAVVVGVGVRPAASWLAGTGIEVDRAVLVDARHRTSVDGIYAAGDVAARWSDRYGSTLWAEHWDEARSGAAVVADQIVGGTGGDSVDEVPYFWSDQFGKKIQYVGHHRGTDRMVIREGADGKWGAAWIDEAGVLRAHLTVSAPRFSAMSRMAIEAGAVVDPDALGDLTSPLPRN